MRPRLIVHLGFHKTGSSSVQALLRANRAALAGRVQCLVQYDPVLRGVESASKAFDRAPSAVTRWRLRRAWRRLLSGIARSGAAVTVISSENLLGRIPSDRDTAPIYAQAGQLLGVLRAEAGDFDLLPVLYLRDGAAWLDSLHRHLVRSRGLTKGLDELATMEKFRQPDRALTDAAARIGQGAGAAPVTLDFDAERQAAPGLGAGLLRIAGLSQDALLALTPVARQNQGIDAAQTAAMQRSAPRWLPKPLRGLWARARTGPRDHR